MCQCTEETQQQQQQQQPHYSCSSPPPPAAHVLLHLHATPAHTSSKWYMCECVRYCSSSSLLFSLLLLVPLPTPTHHTFSYCCHGVCTSSAAWWCTHLLRCGVVVCRIVRRIGKGNAVEEWRWVRCRTGVILRVLCISIQQHMACQRTAMLVMVISLPDLLCCAWLLCCA